MDKFFAFLYRTKYINRWGLMRNTEKENLMEHSFLTAVVAHALAEISNAFFGNHLDAERIAAKALFHDVSEIFTGDMPTPVKYLNPGLKQNYKAVEKLAADKLVEQLPEKLQPVYADLLDEGGEEHVFVKYADKLCAYIKCVKEVQFGNTEFVSAKASIFKELKGYDSREVDYFLDNCIEAFTLTLDELRL